MGIPVFDENHKQVDSVEANEGVFSAEVKPHLVHRAVVMQQASERQGTASTRGRGEVRGGGKKPWKQKHTGRARAGSTRSPIWRHGGTVFGPKPRSYSSDLPKKMYRGALSSALAAKVASEDLTVVADLALAEPKTRLLVKALKQFGVEGKTVLVVEESKSDFIRLGKNVKNLKVLHAKDLNVYDVLWCDKLVITQPEMQRIEEYWG